MSSRGALQRREFHFSGHVQGVGFRYTVQALARGRAVTGYVQNLPDGRVRLVVEGPAEEVEDLVNAIGQRMAAYIRQVQSQSSPATGDFSDFRIRF